MKRFLQTGFCGAVMAFTLAVRAQHEPMPQQWEERLGQPPTAPVLTAKEYVTDVADQTSFTNFLFITNRETSRQFFNLVHVASDNVPMDWSGSYAGCVPGTNSDKYLQAVLRRENYFRAMAGVPAGITFSNEYTRKAQLGALMMGANTNIDHFPPPTWLCYTADGSESARNSNLALGNAGPDAMNALIRDNGTNNAAGGHRRWMLYPQTQKMGCGNVPATGPNPSASVLWVFDTHTFDARPGTRESFVAWPPPGYVPYQVTYARWSFAYANANFNSASVSMTSNGVPLTVVLEQTTNGFGENTLIWVPAGLSITSLNSFSVPATDTVYHVTLNNVIISGGAQSFNYDVRVFNPAVPGPDYFPPVITGLAQPLVNASNVYSFTAVSNANAYEWRQSRLTNLTFVDGAENGLTNFNVNASTNLYSIQDNSVKFAGTYSFHLAHPAPPVNQTLTLKRLLLAATNSTLTFRSRLGYATTVQIARVQISVDDGGSWSDVYLQAGTGGSGEASFTLRTVSLGAYAGRTVRLRFSYDFSQGSYFPQTDPGVGWYVDDFTLTNFQEVLSSTIASANANRTFGFAPTNTGPYLLEVRPVLFGDYPSEFGPSLSVTAVPNTNVVVRITSMDKAGVNTWNIYFSLESGTPAGFELWSRATLPGAFAKEATATIQTIVAGSRYRAMITTAGTQKFFQVKPF